MKCLLIIRSYHHNNTEKVAKVIAEALNAALLTPEQVVLEDLSTYDLVGFGSGIYDGKNHTDLLELADRLPKVNGTKALIFSTSFDKRVDQIHSALREKLKARGYEIIGEFNCGGFNTNSFLKYFGGINKGRPNAEDLKAARMFAADLVERSKYVH